jgi:hypothetical protein
MTSVARSNGTVLKQIIVCYCVCLVPLVIMQLDGYENPPYHLLYIEIALLAVSSSIGRALLTHK